MTAFLQTLIDAAALGSLYALVALAIGLVFGIMRLINFAQSEYIMYGAYALIMPSAAATPVLLVGAWPIVPMLVVVLGFTVLLALATERIAFRPLRNAGAETLMISSFALSHFLQHVAMAIYFDAVQVGAVSKLARGTRRYCRLTHSTHPDHNP